METIKPDRRKTDVAPAGVETLVPIDAAVMVPETPRARPVHGTGAKSAKRPKRKSNNVRKLRVERMMSKAELARRAGISTLTVDRIEKGMPCRMDTKRKILEALDLTPSDRLTVFGEDE